MDFTDHADDKDLQSANYMKSVVSHAFVRTALQSRPAFALHTPGVSTILVSNKLNCLKSELLLARTDLETRPHIRFSLRSFKLTLNSVCTRGIARSLHSASTF